MNSLKSRRSASPLKILSFLFFSALLFGADFGWLRLNSAPAAQGAGTNLAGRILLQVQAQGQAWYVNPLDGRRYYLGRPADAFALMRSLGLGISNADLASFQNIAPARIAGRILLQVQAQGQAYYVNPLNLKLYYLGRPTDAFNLMRSQGLGITNTDLAKIPVAGNNPTTATGGSTTSVSTAPAASIGHFIFKYNDSSYEVFQNLSASWYQAYATAPKIYSYPADNPPPNPRNSFYGMFLQTKAGDTSLDDLIAQLKATASKNNWTNDQLAAFTLALVQYIPYDSAKLSATNNRNTDPYYPYETLYLDRGVCSDKTFLAVALLRRLGYGAAILDFPDLDHSAVGIECPVADSINGSGYCYAETTNYFPIGVIPQNLSQGQAQTNNQFTNMFNPSVLGTIEIYQKTTGQVYQGVAAVKAQVATLAAEKTDINSSQTALNTQSASINNQATQLTNLKNKMDSYSASGQVSEYNSLVPTYNTLVGQYNTAISDYQAQVNIYNQKVNDFNQAVNQFYQR